MHDAHRSSIEPVVFERSHQHDRPSDRLAGWLAPEAIQEVEPVLLAEYERRNRLPRPVNTAGFMMFGLSPPKVEPLG